MSTRAPSPLQSHRPPPLAPEASEPHFVHPEPSGRSRRALRVLRIASGAFALGVTFVASAAAGIVLHVGTPPARRLVAGAVSEILHGTFRGDIVIDRVAGLRVDGIDGGVVRLVGPHGEQLARAEGIHARIALGPLLASLLAGGDLRVDVRELSIDHLEALLVQREDGTFTIAEAFQPAKFGPPPPPQKDASSVRLSMPRIALGHAWVHGATSAVPVVDAELHDLAAAFALTRDATSVDVRKIRLTTRGLPSGADLAAAIEAHLVLPAENVADGLRGSLAIVGAVGGVGVNVRGEVAGSKVDAFVDVPRVAPPDLDRLMGSSPIHDVASLHAEAHGTLPDVTPTVHLEVGAAKVDLRGQVSLPHEGESALVASLDVAARAVDVRAFSATAPASAIAVDAGATARIDGDAIDGSYRCHVPATPIAAQTTPDVTVAGKFTRSSVDGHARVDEPGAPLDLDFAVAPSPGEGQVVTVDARAYAGDLGRLRRIGGAMQGRARVHAAGRLALGTRRVEARVDVQGDEVARGDLTAKRIELGSVVRGTLDAPEIGVQVAARDLASGERAFSRLTAAANVRMRSGVEARDVVVTLAKGKDELTARVASARADGAVVDVDGVRIEGIGAPIDAEAHLRGRSLTAKVRTDGVDLPTVARFASLAASVPSGRLALDVDVTATPRETHGHANAELADLTYADVVRGLGAKVATTFDGRAAEVRVDARDASHNEISVRTENAKLAGGALDPRAWSAATGAVHTQATIDLRATNKSFQPTSPFARMSGWVAAKVDASRDDGRAMPTFAFDVATKRVRFTTRPPTVPVDDATVAVVGDAVHSSDIDAHVTGGVDAERGGAHIEAVLVDPVGKLLQAAFVTQVSMKDLFGGRAKEALLGARIDGRVEVPVRGIDQLPPALAAFPLKGRVGFAVDVDGTAREPSVRVLARADDLADADDPTPVPISLAATAQYDGADAKLNVTAKKAGGEVMTANADARVAARDLLAGVVAWRADADVTFAKLPIGAFTAFAAENRIDGDLSGKISLHGLHDDADLRVDLDLADLDIDGTKLGRVKVGASIARGAAQGDVRLDQLDGSAEVKVGGGMKWGDAVAPSVDDAKGVEVALAAKNFRTIVLQPFLRSVASELDGRLNADAKLHVRPGMKDGSMDGAITLDGGLFETPAVGEELHNLKARIAMKPWGVWNVTELSANGTSGRFTANAIAHLDGFHLRSGEAHFNIEQKDKLPLAAQGVELGTAWGHIDAKGTVGKDGRSIDVAIDVPSFHVELPQSIGHSVQSTDGDPTVHVGMIQPDGRVALLPVDGAHPPEKPEPPKPPGRDAAPPTRIHVATHLGRDVEIRRGTMLRAYVAGGPSVDVGSGTKVGGEIRLPRGYVELQGKRFQIEKATIKFDGQPKDDPLVLATAAYESPDGTKVFADFVGPAKTGKLTLRSNPELSQNEILALLLFGSADGTFGQAAPPGEQGNDTTQAASLAGGVVTDGLNKALTGVSGVDVQTKVDTQETGDPRPEVEVGISRDVSATVIYNLGVPPPGQNPDDTLLVVGWRFHRNYSTQATLGDRGTSILDLTWKYRY